MSDMPICCRCRASGEYEVIRGDLGWYVCARHIGWIVYSACRQSVVIKRVRVGAGA